MGIANFNPYLTIKGLPQCYLEQPLSDCNASRQCE